MACWTMFYRELLRFWRVGLQTLIAPMLTSGLYLLVFGTFSHAKVEGYGDISYLQFIVPGLIIMTLLQNSFANTASSITQGKVMGSLVFLINSPMTHWDWFASFVGAAVVRGVVIAIGLGLMLELFVPTGIDSLGIVMVFAVLGGVLMGSLGMIAGLVAEKFDHLTSFQNFIIMPLTFLSGVFFTVHQLPYIWHVISMFNPCFYLVDGFRYGFFGSADVSIWISFSVVFGFTAVVAGFCIYLLKIGYRLRS